MRCELVNGHISCWEDDDRPIPADDPRVAVTLQTILAPPPPVKTVRVPLLRALTAEELAARLAACVTCCHLRSDGARCGLMSCGCSLPNRRASSLASCPGLRWPALNHQRSTV